MNVGLSDDGVHPFAILADKGSRLRVAGLCNEALLCLLLRVLVRAFVMKAVCRYHFTLRLLQRFVRVTLQAFLFHFLGLLE